MRDKIEEQQIAKELIIRHVIRDMLKADYPDGMPPAVAKGISDLLGLLPDEEGEENATN